MDPQYYICNMHMYRIHASLMGILFFWHLHSSDSDHTSTNIPWSSNDQVAAPTFILIQILERGQNFVSTAFLRSELTNSIFAYQSKLYKTIVFKVSNQFFLVCELTLNVIIHVSISDGTISIPESGNNLSQVGANQLHIRVPVKPLQDNCI